jgi:hypothetical protein
MRTYGAFLTTTQRPAPVLLWYFLGGSLCGRDAVKTNSKCSFHKSERTARSVYGVLGLYMRTYAHTNQAWACIVYLRGFELQLFFVFGWALIITVIIIIIIPGVHGSVVGWGTMLQAGRSRVRVPVRWIFLFNQSFQPHYGPGFDSASNRNKYQESSWRVKGGRRVRQG